ncbi:MAG: AmmeMemoRadiSam system protein B [Anaerolineae bacterium]
MAEVRLHGTRRAKYAGTWYPGSYGALSKTVDDFLSRADVRPLAGDMVALIAPHAGYVYSGQVAAYAYRPLQEAGKTYETVVLVGPSHRMYLDGFGVTAVENYETPLGLIPLDEGLLEILSAQVPDLKFLSRDDEHSLEIQLPFLQRTLGGFRLVPIMMGEQSQAACQELGQALGRVLAGRSALLVASTDLSHYKDYEQANALDRLIVERVEAFDHQGLARLLAQGKAEACGGGPVVATMIAAQALGADRAQVLKYANSGDVTGDRAHVVGYMAAALYKSVAQT